MSESTKPGSRGRGLARFPTRGAAAWAMVLGLTVGCYKNVNSEGTSPDARLDVAQDAQSDLPKDQRIDTNPDLPIVGSGGNGTGGAGTGTGGRGGMGAGGANTGGANTGGANTGGTNTGGANTGGANTGGANTGGTGGAGTGGANTGGANTGGANTGGANTGGANTGGANTGGANTGGANTGGAGTGGAGTGGCVGSQTDPTRCGTACTSCPTPNIANARAICVAGQCGVECLTNFHYCSDDSCRPNGGVSFCATPNDSSAYDAACQCTACTRRGQTGCCGFCQHQSASPQPWIEGWDPGTGLCLPGGFATKEAFCAP